VDDEMKKLLRALSDAVNESLVNSSAFMDAIAALWRAGQEASLPSEAELADTDDGLSAMNADLSDPTALLTLTADDEYFLRALRIATPV
jgi:hypothetical protein